MTYIFSYNRPKHLANALDSLRRHCTSWDYMIIDDHSDDPEMLALLEANRGQVPVVRSRLPRSANHHGNLYDNMNWAMEHARQQGFDYAVLYQDDIQIVRDFELCDHTRTHDFFQKYTDSFQIFPMFLEISNARRIRQYLITDTELGFYLQRPGTGYFRRLSFCDGGIVHVERFHDIFGKFESSERASEIKAQSLGLRVGYEAYPYASFLPFSNWVRGDEPLEIARLIGDIAGCGFYPLQAMTQNQLRELRQRDIQHLPFAEQWLSCPGTPVRDIWGMWGGIFNLELHGGDRADLADTLNYIQNTVPDRDVKHTLIIQALENWIRRHRHDDTSHCYN